MKILKFLITEKGEPGEIFRDKTPESEKQTVVPGASLAALFEEEEDDWDGDVPDVSADFARIRNGGADPTEKKLPLTAEFEELPDGNWALIRWPRLSRPAIIPAILEGKPVVSVAATAFAPFHIPETRFNELYSSPISFSVFGMRMGRFTVTEDPDEGGPTSISLPETIRHIGEHAFWHCDNLKELRIPVGVRSLPAGVFGDCSNLQSVELPEGLDTIGYFPKPTDQVMPDMGTFAGCHELKELQLPSTIKSLGAHLFNSCGIIRLSVRCPETKKSGGSPEHRYLGESTAVAQTAFDHSAALRWLDLTDRAGSTIYECALPPARDKILAGDRSFGALLRIPADFFNRPIAYFDRLAREAFRLDFSVQMALSRLAYPLELSEEDRKWYFDLLVKYFERSPQFYPGLSGEAAFEKMFDFLQGMPDMTASDMSELLRQAGLLGLSADFIARMIEIRTRRFSAVTGFEDLELDLDL